MKKIITILMVTVMVVICLSGCGKNNTTAGTLKNGVYTPDEDLSIELWFTQGSDYTPGEEISDNIISKWLYNKTLVKFDSIYGNGGGQWDVKLSRLVTGNNLPQVITCGAFQGPSHFAKLAQAEQIWEITDDMLNTYAPNVLKRVPKDVLDMFRIDGKIYGIPYYQPSSAETNPKLDKKTLSDIDEYVKSVDFDENMRLWIRDDILKQIYPEAKSWKEIEKIAEEKKAPIADECFDIPIKTKEEYIDFMYKIKTLNLMANGKPVYAYGYSGGDNWEALCYIGGDMMGYSPHYYTSTWRDDKQEIEIPLVTDVCKEGAKIQNRFIRDKVFDPESLVHTIEMYKEKALNGQYAIVPADFVGGVQSVNATLKEQGAGYRYRPFTVQIQNRKEYQVGKQNNYWGESLCFTKSLSENELIQMLNWINVCFSEEFDEIYWWGTPEDKLYTEENSVRKYVDDKFNKRFINGDKSALDNKETKGIGQSIGDLGIWFTPAVDPSQSAYAPMVYNKNFIKPVYSAVISFPKNSEHAVSKVFPPKEAWSACYSGVEEVVKYWSEREKWENAFKIAFTASSDEDFDNKWDEAVATLNNIVDIKTMEQKMTEIAREELKKIKQ